MRVLGLAAVVLFLVTAFTPLANVASRALEARERLEPADAIVVLATAVFPDGTLTDSSLRRALHGVLLHRRNLAPLLVLTGIVLPEGGADEAAARARLARTLGVPAEAVVTVSGVQTTREEARRATAVLRPRGVRRVLLVSDAQHLIRARALFARAGFEVLPAPVDQLPADTTTPAARLHLTQEVLQELLARLAYRLAGQL
jgi:uncharacterized SAM-binding protein YcdF (DUF218 family)